MNWFSSLVNRRHRMLARMGFTLDQEGIFVRYARERAGWDIHLKKSKETILDFVNHTRCRDLVVLGSGWLLDVPLHELAQLCRTVYLYDIVHPGVVKHKASKYSNVVLVEADITGGLIEDVYNNISRAGKSFTLDMVPVPTLNIAHDSDGVVSLNILNQLDILLCDYILSQTSVDDDRLLEFRKQIQKSHLTFLESRSSCLITDVEERTCDPNGSNPSSKMLVHVPLPSTTHQLSWEWRFDQNGSYRQNRVTTFAVQARW